LHFFNIDFDKLDISLLGFATDYIIVKSGVLMRLFVILTLVISVTALAQTRVRENIKQQSVATSDDGSGTLVKSAPKRPVKAVQSKK
jgi:hypothetical protein